MKLISLPDCKKIHKFLTIGKEYECEYFSCNGVKITMDNGEKVIILKSRLQ